MQEMQENHVKRATTLNAQAGIFWHYESTTVPIEQIEDFANKVKSHLINFESKTFTAVATADCINNNNPELTERMRHANIYLMTANDDEDAVQTIQKQMRDFYDDHHEDGSWMVLITGSYKFYNTIDHYQHNRNFRDLVLVYNQVQDIARELSEEEQRQIQRLAEHAPKKTPLRYFLDLITSRAEADEKASVSQQENNQRVFFPEGESETIDIL